MRSWIKYIDESGLPVGVYTNGAHDGGDTANRVGLINTALVSSNKISPADLFETPYNPIKAFIDLEVIPGMIVRHPTLWRDLKDMTRDNQRPYTQALILWSSVKDINDILNRIFYVHRGAKFKYPSGDISGPSVIADYLRAGLITKNPVLNKIGLWLGDLDLLISCIIQIIVSHHDYDNVDRSVNIFNTLRFNQLTKLTFIGRLAHFLFTGLVSGGVEHQIDHYFRQQEENSPYSTSPPINELSVTIINEGFKKWTWP